MIWREFWFGQEKDEDKVVIAKQIFKKRKYNYPRKHKTPLGLKNFINAIQSEIFDPKNRNKVESNLANDEISALKELINLQRSRKIVIKPCDKGAGIIVLNFNDYMKACTDHLNAKVEVPGEPDKYYYEEIDPKSVASVMITIRHLLEKGVEDGIITEDQYNEMLPFGKNPGKLYCIF